MPKTRQELLEDINEKLDFMIDGLSRQIVKKDALGQKKVMAIGGAELFTAWKKMQAKDTLSRIIPNESINPKT